MPSLGVDAVMFTLNVLLFVLGGMVAACFLVWSVASRRALREIPIGALPRAIGWMMAFEAISALIYALARYGRGTGSFDLWDLIPILVVCRLGILSSTLMHMPPYWRAHGVAESVVRARTILMAVMMAAAIPLMTLVFW